MDVQPKRVPAVPSIPADAKSKPTHGLRPRRRSSVPAVPADVLVKKRSPNIVRTQTASPEVISSLIDSLSAISISAQNHFENLPLSYGESASVPTSPLSQNFGPQDADLVDRSVLHSLNDQSPSYHDDACEPPVIRTSKRPSGLSPLTAHPKRKDKDNSLKSYISRGGGSSASVHSAQSIRSVSSFGNISIEAGIPRKPSDSSNRTSSESKRSSKGHRSLMYMSSRERLRLKDTERKRGSSQGTEAATLPEIARKPTAQRLIAKDTIKEEPVVAESSAQGAKRRPSRGTSPLRNGVNLLNGADGGSPTEKGLIPERGSSLRHSGSPSRKSKRRDGRKSGRHDSYRTNTVPEEDESVAHEAIGKDKILKELEAEEDEVAQRIRELRKKKLLRDRIAGKLPIGVDAGVSASAPRVSPAATTFDASPASSVSSLPERRVRAQGSAKAHKVLGITMQRNAPERQVAHFDVPQPRPTSKTEARVTRKERGHQRIRSLTVNDGDELTPLPINYRLALQALEQPERTPTPTPLTPIPTLSPPPPPPPPSSSNASSTGRPSSSGTPPRRTRSLAVGGRSAASRQSTSSMIMTTNTAHHRHSNSVTSGGSDRALPLRSTSEEISSRHQSLGVSPASLHSLQHRPTLKKKRWSHPDLPAKAERSRNAKIDAMEAAARANAVQSPPHSVIEERPTSADSIDMEVESYLNSTRLSQKIRHPQTGRVISFSEVGDPNGFTVFVCVGMGLTRYVMAFYDQLAATLKLRLITPDRPGIGGSDVDPNGTPLSWPGEHQSSGCLCCANVYQMMFW